MALSARQNANDLKQEQKSQSNHLKSDVRRAIQRLQPADDDRNNPQSNHVKGDIRRDVPPRQVAQSLISFKGDNRGKLNRLADIVPFMRAGFDTSTSTLIITAEPLISNDLNVKFESL